MRRSIALLALMAAAGCASPPFTVGHNIGMVKDSLFEEARDVLAREGIDSERGLGVSGTTGIRVRHEDAYFATRILLEWRRGKEPGAYITRTEFEMGPENP